MEQKYPTVKEILFIASIGAFILGSFLFPGLPVIFKKGSPFSLENLEKFFNEDTWDQFDKRRLKEQVKRLHKKKWIKIYKIGDKTVVQITKNGRKRLLQYKIQDLEIPKPTKWDGKWRLVGYDIPKEKTMAQHALRRMLKNLGFLRLQKSFYIYPYPCKEIIEFLREVYGVGECVTFLTTGFLEDEEFFLEHFSLHRN